jgi:predicted GTPase
MPREARRVVIMGAAGRDFHVFNTVFRGDPGATVVAFTAAQIPGIAGRRYPAELAGPRYPRGIPIEEEGRLEELCRTQAVDEVVFAYSDVTHESVMHAGSRALATGADFVLCGPRRTMLASDRPVVAVSAARTGCGKSAVSRYLSACLRRQGRRVGVIRHPMPYGDLVRAKAQRFASRHDLEAAGCTIEEREEYEPHIAAGSVVFAGVDYEAVLAAAEADADVIIWDGGNNDFPFIRPDLHIAIVDALRPGEVATHHPGETVVRMADVVVISKVDALNADPAAAVRAVGMVNRGAKIVLGASPVHVDAAAVRGRRVLVVEDGPTMTHGGMSHGAGLVAARSAGAAEIIDPREAATPAMAAVLGQYPQIGPVLPAIGYQEWQLAALRATIEASRADVVVSATPIDLAALLELRKPVVRAGYEYADAAAPALSDIVQDFVERLPRKDPKR